MRKCGYKFDFFWLWEYGVSGGVGLLEAFVVFLHETK